MLFSWFNSFIFWIGDFIHLTHHLNSFNHLNSKEIRFQISKKFDISFCNNLVSSHHKINMISNKQRYSHFIKSLDRLFQISEIHIIHTQHKQLYNDHICVLPMKWSHKFTKIHHFSFHLIRKFTFSFISPSEIMRQQQRTSTNSTIKECWVLSWIENSLHIRSINRAVDFNTIGNKNRTQIYAYWKLLFIVCNASISSMC